MKCGKVVERGVTTNDTILYFSRHYCYTFFLGKKKSSLNTLQSSSAMNSLLFLLFVLKFPQILTLLYLKSLMSKYLFIFLSLSLTANTLILPCDAICTRYRIHQLSQSRRNVSSYLTMNGQQTED
jgi:hypothetical protein